MTDNLVNRIDCDGMAIVELNRPARRNAITAPMMDELAAVLDALSADESVRAVLLCGAEGAFCSGLDLTEYNAEPPPAWIANAATSLRGAHVALANCPVPVVVALERYAINGGAALALAGDLIIVGEESWLQVGEVRQGMPAPMNIAWLVARYPLATALRVTLTGDRLHGPALAALGIAHEVVPDADIRTRAEELAAEIASYPAGATRAIKTTVLGLADVLDAADYFERAATLGRLDQARKPQRQTPKRQNAKRHTPKLSQ